MHKNRFKRNTVAFGIYHNIDEKFQTGKYLFISATLLKKVNRI